MYKKRKMKVLTVELVMSQRDQVDLIILKMNGLHFSWHYMNKCVKSSVCVLSLFFYIY